MLANGYKLDFSTCSTIYSYSDPSESRPKTPYTNKTTKIFHIMEEQGDFARVDTTDVSWFKKKYLKEVKVDNLSDLKGEKTTKKDNGTVVSNLKNLANEAKIKNTPVAYDNNAKSKATISGSDEVTTWDDVTDKLEEEIYDYGDYDAYVDEDIEALRALKEKEGELNLILNAPEDTKELYSKDLSKYTNMFGAPFLFLESADPCYFTSASMPNIPRIGRVMMDTIYSTPAVFSIFPGKVRYLPGFNKTEKDQFFGAVMDRLNAEADEDTARNMSDSGRLGGQLYDLQSDWADYMNRFNILARVCSIMLGIGDYGMPGTTGSGIGGGIPLRSYDYSYFTTSQRNTNVESISGTFLRQIGLGAESAIIQKNQYIHFFLNHEGSSVDESHTITQTESPLESLINSSKLGDAAKNLSYLFGGMMSGNGFQDAVGGDIEKLIQEANASGSYVGSFANMALNYIKGGRMVVPNMIDEVMYENSVSCHMKFHSLTGSKLDIFLRTILPALAILNFVMPKQLTENMYTYPYIVRCYEPGNYICDLGVISQMSLNRGGPDATSWTVDGLSTELEVQFTITPLYSSLMGGNGKNPFQFLSNTALLEYLGNLCGLDLKVNNILLKQELFNQLLANKITGIGNSIGAKWATKIANKVQNLFSF